METFAPEIEQAAQEFEKQKKEGEEQEADPVAEEERINQEYEHVLREYTAVNEGHNGVILKVAAEDVPKPIAQRNNIEDDAAVKVLKVYNSGKAYKEYNAQKLAYDLVEANRGSSDYAKVPKPLDVRRVSLTEETRKKLNKDNRTSLTGNEAEVVMMDYVDGADDLATICYKWVMDHPPAGKEYITAAGRFDQLQDAVAQMLDFRRPSGKGTEDERRTQERLVANDNSARLYKYLKKTGFKLNGRVVKQIRNTMRLFEQNGLYHNDNHERNFMVRGDYTNQDSDDVEVFVIDYGSATINQKPDDSIEFSLDKQLETLVPEVEEKQERETLENMQNRIRKISTDPKLPERYKRIMAAAENPDIQFIRELINRAQAVTSSEQGSEDFMALLVNLRESDKLSAASALQVVEHMKNSMKLPVYFRGKLVRFKISNQAVYNQIDKLKQLLE